MKEFGWCFIGTGRLAHMVAKQLLSSGRHKIVSCYTRDFEKAKAFGEKYSCKAYEKAEDAISDSEVEGVYVVTPHNAHYRFVKMALNLNKPVLCEKAFTVTAKEAEELIGIAREKKIYLCEAMWTWFSASANKCKEWIDEERIGKIQSASFTYHMKSINFAPRVSDPKRAGGALLDITVYPITYAYHLWGMPQKIKAEGRIENGIDVTDDIVFSYDGFDVAISASIVDGRNFEKMRIKGEKGVISALLYHMMNGITLSKGLFNREKFTGPGPKFNSYLDEFDTAAKDIRAGRTESAEHTLDNTLDVMKIMDEIRAQIKLNYEELE
ncbi:MAG: Gfo/Idh/MocA family oxidoreductase [Erysipelotrichaceae bacterium]|nr:Gfo/Idh/MocA family oxidoreductase [Erysipelotrichaceae bacterium]